MDLAAQAGLLAPGKRMEYIDTVAVLRLAFILGDVLAFGLAAAIVFGDFAILSEQSINTGLFAKASKIVTLA